MKTEFGLPLVAPVTQTLLPVVVMRTSVADVVGFVPVASTEYTQGEFSTVLLGDPSLGEAEYTIGSVTIPQKDQNEHSHLCPPKQFVAVLFAPEEASKRPWLGINNFYSASTSGFSSYWNAPSSNRARANWTFGPLVGSLVINAAQYTTVIEDSVPTPGVDDGVLSWTASVDRGANHACSTLEFDWLTVFNAEVTAGKLPMDAVPLVLQVVSTPEEFSAKLNPNPVIVPKFGKVYNSVRITRERQEIEAGDYTFEFLIHHNTKNGTASKSVELTLTIQ